MSIVIESNISILQARLNIPASRMSEYKDMTVEEILKSEAAAGNQAAIMAAADMFTDVDELMELFRLADPRNKLAIMSEMSPKQLEQLVLLLEPKDLLEGLKFFTQDNLLKFLKDIPKEELVKTMLEMFSEEKLIKFLPENELDKLLTGFDLDKNNILKSMAVIPETYLQQIIESVTGEEAQGNSEQLIRQIGAFGDLDFKNAIRNFEPDQKRDLVFIITNNDKRLYENFDTGEYLHIIDKERDKDELIQAMGVIKPEHLQKMINTLPQDLLSIVTTQIDTQKFAKALIDDFPELLAQFVAA